MELLKELIRYINEDLEVNEVEPVLNYAEHLLHKEQDLLKKYIEHIEYCEGIDYLSDSKIKQSKVEFTKEEVETLRGL